MFFCNNTATFIMENSLDCLNPKKRKLCRRRFSQKPNKSISIQTKITQQFGINSGPNLTALVLSIKRARVGIN